MRDFRNWHITIAGLGVIGGSGGLALRKRECPYVYGIDTNPESLKKALQMGIIREGDTQGEELLKRSDLVVIALYPGLVADFLRERKGIFAKGALLTDVTGVKGQLAGELAGILKDRPDLDFILGHPMAGREKSGIEYASEVVFRDANYLIAVRPENTREHIETIKEFALFLGFGRVTEVTPDFHDEMIAYTSQLTHAIAVALMTSDIEGRDTGKYIGDSFRDLTRIANINEELWAELFLANKEALLAAMAAFSEEFSRIETALEENDPETLKKMFRRSTRRRNNL
ncbi:MAG: prephenate dehydrogenase [Fusobacteriaceae bacterium]|nr:prephenate dehydrogenase [Fusobacteriaceae bacterium]